MFSANEYLVNSNCSLTSVIIYTIMSDEHNNLDYEYNDQGDELLNQSEDQEEPMEQDVAK